MKITAYNQHDVGSFSSLGRFAASNILRDRANVVMQSSVAEGRSRNLLRQNIRIRLSDWSR